jgi:hypothetical protein
MIDSGVHAVFPLEPFGKFRFMVDHVMGSNH